LCRSAGNDEDEENGDPKNQTHVLF
jgi:hypothetical protein